MAYRGLPNSVRRHPRRKKSPPLFQDGFLETMATTLAMVFKLAERAQKRWRRLRGYKLIQKVINGVKFIDGTEETLAA